MAKQTLSGTDVTIKADDIAVGCAQSISATITTAVSAASCRESGGWDENAAGRHSWTATIDAAWRVATGADATGQKTVKDFVALQIARTPVEIDFGSAITGDTRYVGTAIITSTALSAPEDGVATWTLELTGTGPLVPTVNA